MAGAKINLDVSVNFGTSSITFKLSNQVAINIKHEKELLAKTYMETVRGYLPSGLNLPNLIDKFEDRFKAVCGGAERRYRNLKGRAKAAFLKKERTVTMVLPPESCSNKKNEETVKDIMIRALQEDLCRMESLTEKSINELKANVHAFEVQCLQLQDQNSQLRLQVQQNASGQNKGKMVGEGCGKTDSRKLKNAGSSVLRALETVLETYGLNVCQLLVTDVKGFLHNIAYKENGDIAVTRKVKKGFPHCRKVDYDLLSSPEKSNVREVTALLDNHFVSNAFWKEISATMPNLPPMQLVNSYREKLDARISVFKTPGEFPGAQVRFEDDLRQAVLELAAEKKIGTRDLATEKLVVKIEGDGCVVSRSTSWTTLSFVLIDKERSLQSHRLHRLLAVVEGSEKYFNIKESFRDLLDDINAVAERGSISVDNHDIKVSICLGSDLKFLLVVLGLQAASSRYPCPFCRADPKERSAAGANSNQYNEPPFVRTCANMREDCANEDRGMKYIPLFSIDPRCVIPDLLHMKIRIVNRLIDGLLAESEDRDNREKVQNLNAPSSHLKNSVAAINSCGVKFEVWEEEKNGRTFTSLAGGDCQTLLPAFTRQAEGKT
ncbi:hypothetical protein HPB48_026444 [Haemaphysalis longicornis]|uniref:Uncharacterized protein n=1 Tax=Haemaphysalis longicornis TaxID=44386 RepID=A0A9J6HCB6_HAELO|nr:hypothetical protein HPB48_026444 [Haemaphysalis longicornis]